MDVTRYDLYTGESGPSICDEPEGRYVKFDDYVELDRIFNRKIDFLKSVLKTWQYRAEKSEAANAEALKLLRRIDGIAIKKKSGAIGEVQSIVRAFLPYPWKTFND